MTDTQQFLLELIEYAETAKPTEFQLIKTWEESRFYIKKYRGNKLIIKALQQSANELFKTYCRELQTTDADLTKLLAYRHLIDIQIFYVKEGFILKRMLDEYDEYLDQGNFWAAFFGSEREV